MILVNLPFWLNGSPILPSARSFEILCILQIERTSLLFEPLRSLILRFETIKSPLLVWIFDHDIVLPNWFLQSIYVLQACFILSLRAQTIKLCLSICRKFETTVNSILLDCFCLIIALLQDSSSSRMLPFPLMILNLFTFSIRLWSIYF